MTLNSGRYRRACDQRAIIIKQDLLVCDGDDDLQCALRSVLRCRFLRQFRLCLGEEDQGVSIGIFRCARGASLCCMSDRPPQLRKMP
jgi:hypothetical protein